MAVYAHPQELLETFHVVGLSQSHSSAMLFEFSRIFPVDMS